MAKKTVEASAGLAFPSVPPEILKFRGPEFIPSVDLERWARSTFIDAGSILENPDHLHLRLANLLFVWAARPGKLNNNVCVGTCEFFKPQETKWSTRRSAELIRAWNGGTDPTFIITICASYVKECEPEEVCALVEHELYHAGHALDEFGQKKYTKRGMPVYAMRGHDVEEFVGVVKRYGATGQMREMKTALDAVEKTGPGVKRLHSRNAVCGCGARV